MAAFNKFNSFVEAVGRKKHNLDADTLKVMLTNTAPVAGNSVKADLVDIAAGGGYSAGGAAVANNDFTQAGGTATLTGDDIVFTGSGGGFGPFRYAVLYNDTAASDELIGWWDYGSSISVGAGETFTVDFGASILTVAWV